jgi:DNA anti-recombination protein RmuC
MDLSNILLVFILILLIFLLIYLIFYLPHRSQIEGRLLTQTQKNNEELVKFQLNSLSEQQKSENEKQERLLGLRLDQIEKELQKSREDLSQQQEKINQQQEKLLKLHLNSLSEQQKESSKKQEQLLQLRLESFGQELKTSRESLNKINSLLLTPFERGHLGNIQLDRLLSLYLPKDNKIYKLEYTLKKKTTKEGGLRPDAVVFGIEQKNNLAICEKKSSKC